MDKNLYDMLMVKINDFKLGGKLYVRLFRNLRDLTGEIVRLGRMGLGGLLES